MAAAPDSAEGYLALGRALESAGSIQPAIESYRRAQLLEGGEREAEEQIRWAEERLAAKSHSVSLSEEALRRYEGRYLEGRAVRLREGRLYYESSARPTSPLAPMGEDLFEVEADPFVRVRFVVEGGTGPAVQARGDLQRRKHRGAESIVTLSRAKGTMAPRSPSLRSG